MDSSMSEEITVSPEEAELPDMVPVSIRTTLGEFQHFAPLERVLAGVLLTWTEFLQLFDIRVKSSDYVIRGSNGTVADLNDKIGDYVNSFKRKMKIYPVTLERATSFAETPRGHRTSTNSEGSNQSKTEGVADDNKSGGPSSKKLKLMDEDKRKRNHRKMTKESLEKIAQTVMQGQSTSSKKNAKKADNKRGSNKSRSPTPTTAEIKPPMDLPSTSKSSTLQSTTATEAGGTSSKVKRLSTNQSQVKDVVPSTSSAAAPVTKRGRKPRNSRTLSSRRSTKESTNTVMESNEDESSDSDDEEDPTKEMKKLLKQNVIKYLSEKVSARSFLRLRNELMTLRDQEKYFKVTTVVPITAGMMEQAFCRKLTE